jgi:formylglycine-generating enzyme required for sulfatase activity
MRAIRDPFRSAVVWAAWLFIAFSAVLSAKEPARVALVIGNADYHQFPLLKTTANDATDMAAKLRVLGFRIVGDKAHVNVDHEEMARLVQEFAKATQNGETALFYYAGHGAAFEGNDWLLPVNDQNIETADDLQGFALSANYILDRMQRRAGGINILILDACRDSRLPGHNRSTLGTRGLEGLSNVARGSVVLYAASLNQAAEEGSGRNGVYTGVLLGLIDKPGQPIDEIQRQSVQQVSALTSGKQVPSIQSNLSDAFYFVRPQVPSPTPPPPPAETFRDCEDACPLMVAIRPGTLMGSSGGTRYSVPFVRGFAVGVYPVTVAEWRRYVNDEHPSLGPGCNRFAADGKTWTTDPDLSWEHPFPREYGYRQGDTEPVVCVSWEDARGFMKWLSAKAHHNYRLLSEAEFDYVNRADVTTIDVWGDAADAEQCRHVNGADLKVKKKRHFTGVADCDDGYLFTSPINSFPANHWGVRDTTGNVFSWLEDCWHDSYAPRGPEAWEQGCEVCPPPSATRPQDPQCELRVIRGGSWNDSPELLKLAYRDRLDHRARGYGTGFRVARDD